MSVVSDPSEALSTLAAGCADVALASLPFRSWSAEQLLDEAARVAGATPILVHEPDADASRAVYLARLGAVQVLAGEPDPDAWATRLQAVARAGGDGGAGLSGPSREPWRRFLVGSSPAIEEVARIVRLVGSRRATVLVTGETGTGKEMAARALHMAGPRGARPLISVSCAALPETLLEAELFGYVRGAFTGAVATRAGRFEQANGGTLFLDEIGDMPLDLQSKLLRVLQEREFQRLGSGETIAVDVRVIAATNADLARRVEEGRFREDLYYRLNVVPIHMPPLRERPGDIAVLARHFASKICSLEGIAPKQISPEALERLERREWPGNVRQLENAVEMAVALSGDRRSLDVPDFPAAGRPAAKARLAQVWPLVPVPDSGLDFEETVSRIERQILEQALRKTRGNKKMAAAMLGLKRTTLTAKLRSLEVAVGA